MIQKVTRKKKVMHNKSYEAINIKSFNFLLKLTINVNLFKLGKIKIKKY